MIIIFICLIIGIYLMIRNILVFNFVRYLNRRGYEICKNYIDSIPDSEYDSEAQKNLMILRETWESICDIPYSRMVLSFKPLKPEYWLDEKQLNFLKINTF